MHLRDYLLSYQLQRAYAPTFPPVVEGMRLTELEGSKRVSFTKCSEWFGTKSHLPLLGLSQPIRGFPTIESGTFQHKTRGMTSRSM